MKYIKTKYCIVETFQVQTIVKGFFHEDEFFTLYRSGILEVRKGFCWDGATGAFDTADFMVPSLVHDIFCILVNEKRLPDYVQALADEQMRLLEKQAGMYWARRMLTYFAVRFFQINKRPGSAVQVFEVAH